MTRSQLMAKLVAANPQLHKSDVEWVVAVIFEQIAAALARGDRVELRGFGAFTAEHRRARQGRNPRTGASIDVSEKYVPRFKAGKALRYRLNRQPE